MCNTEPSQLSDVEIAVNRAANHLAKTISGNLVLIGGFVAILVAGALAAIPSSHSIMTLTLLIVGLSLFVYGIAITPRSLPVRNLKGEDASKT